MPGKEPRVREHLRRARGAALCMDLSLVLRRVAFWVWACYGVGLLWPAVRLGFWVSAAISLGSYAASNILAIPALRYFSRLQDEDYKRDAHRVLTEAKVGNLRRSGSLTFTAILCLALGIACLCAIPLKTTPFSPLVLIPCSFLWTGAAIGLLAKRGYGIVLFSLSMALVVYEALSDWISAPPRVRSHEMFGVFLFVGAIVFMVWCLWTDRREFTWRGRWFKW